MNPNVAAAQAPEPAPDSPTLYKTLTGQRLHIPGCPHVGSALVEARPADLLALTVCEWCRAEIDGVGRTYYTSLVEAMRALGCHIGTHQMVSDALRFVRHDQIWLPHSKSYVALGLGGPGVAWVGKGYVFIKESNAFLELPGYRPSAGGGSPRVERIGGICPVHFEATSLTGICGSCSD